MRSRSRRDRKPAKRRRPAPVSDSFRERRLACPWPSAATRNAVAGISITTTVAAPRDAYRTRAMRCRGHPTRDQKGGRGQARDAGFGTEVASGAFVIWRTDPPARIVYLVSHGGRSETREGSARHLDPAELKPLAPKRPPRPWHAVSIVPGSQPCAAAAGLVRKRFLSREAPHLAAQGLRSGAVRLPLRTPRRPPKGPAPREARWAFRSTVTMVSTRTSAAARSAAVARPTASSQGTLPLSPREREAEASLLTLNAAHQREPHPGFDAERGGLERLARHKHRVAAHHVAHR